MTSPDSGNLIHGRYYHLYNRGINVEALFKEASDYERFLSLLAKYINTVAEIYAWCLMGNHFHLLVKIREKEEIGFYIPFNADRSDDAVRLKTTTDLSAFAEPDSVNNIVTLREPDPARHFSHLFNAYARYFNIKNSRHGALFERPFRRKELNDPVQRCNLVAYIHNNPVKHGFCRHPVEYSWSSYVSFLDREHLSLNQKKVIGWFGSEERFFQYHKSDEDMNDSFSLE